MSKKLLAITLALAMMFGVGIYADNAVAAENIKVIVNSKQVQFDVPPKTINNRTMVPMRAIFESLGATVEYAPTTKTITAKRNGEIVICTIGNRNMTVNGSVKTMDVSPVAISGRTLVPARFIAEAFACDVQWDEQSKTVTITSGNQGGVSSSKGNCYAGTDVRDYGKFSNTATLISSGSLDSGLQGKKYVYSEPKQSLDNDIKYFNELTDKSVFWDYFLALTEDDYELYDYFGQPNGQFVVELGNEKTLVQIMTDAYVCGIKTPTVTVQYTPWKGESTSFNNDLFYYLDENFILADMKYWTGRKYADFMYSNRERAYMYSYDISRLKKVSGEYYGVDTDYYNGLTINQFMMLNGLVPDTETLDGEMIMYFSPLTGDVVGIRFDQIDGKPYLMVFMSDE